jgi:hypothetical protein
LRAQDLDLKECFKFSEWPTERRGRWGPIYSPHTNIIVGESEDQTVLSDKFGEPLWNSESRTCLVHQANSVKGLDKSGNGL